MQLNSPNFHSACLSIRHLFCKHASIVHTERWQGLDVSKRPEAATHELLNFSLCVPLYGTHIPVLAPGAAAHLISGGSFGSLEYWREDIQPHLPWADDHFAERVGGEPLNPGETWKTWRHSDSAGKFIQQGQFNHTYPERLWPKFAHNQPSKTAGDFWHPETGEHVSDLAAPRQGVRHSYGDLSDLVTLLVRDPLTRQAYIPLFFPEDTGIGDGGRKPCTLGYQFIMRDNKLHVYYPMRSCDFANHFRDDCYLAVRLLLWVIEQCRKKERAGPAYADRANVWDEVTPGTLTIHCTSLHLFRNDYLKLCKEANSS